MHIKKNSQDFRHLFLKMIHLSAVLCLALSAFVASAANVPYQVSLQLKRNHFCGGSILSPEWILTTAKCVEGKIYSNGLEVVAGTTNLYPEDAGVQRVKVSTVVVHEDKGKSSAEPRLMYNDIALLKLAKPLKLGGNVQAIQIDHEDLKIPDELTVSGWGVELLELEADELQVKQMQAVAMPDCKKSWGVYFSPDMYGFLGPANYSPVNDIWYICGGHFDKRSPCKGEDNLNGGPVVSHRTQKQIGLVTLSDACGKLQRPSVFTKVGDYISWIEAKTGLSL